MKCNHKQCRQITLSGISGNNNQRKSIIPESKSHHSVRAPLRDEGMGLILWHYNFNQWNSVTDALQNHIINELIFIN